MHTLKQMDLKIIIASHRDQETKNITQKWLVENDLIFDELYVGNDKSVLFSKSCALVDDNPLILQKAQDHGLLRTGLLKPWNIGAIHPLFDTLNDIAAYVSLELPHMKLKSTKFFR